MSNVVIKTKLSPFVIIYVRNFFSKCLFRCGVITQSKGKLLIPFLNRLYDLLAATIIVSNYLFPDKYAAFK